MVVVPPVTNAAPWSLEVETKELGVVRVKIKRTQLPVVTVKASTLHVLQGTACDPGLIFHWDWPNRLMVEQKWLAVYVALSRVRDLNSLRSVGLGKKVRRIIEQGPPQDLVATFHQLFDEKITNTKKLAAKLAEQYGLLPGMI